MLETNSRRTYLSELRPPEGFVLDRAVASTFSLDLVTLLMAPLAMAMFESESREKALRDPIAIMESLRQASGKFAVFCQQGRIATPRSINPLFSYLEKAVVEVRPPREEGIFHAKTWLLRFVGEGRPVTYRFLCLSRNLTFDRSWDTVLTLEGELKDRKVAYGRNNPLGDFFAALPELSVLPVSEQVRANVALLAEEVRKVEFNLPGEEFENLEFLPFGLPGRGKPQIWSDSARSARIMVVSPFVRDKELQNLAKFGKNNLLISRSESLDAVSEAIIQDLKGNCDIYVLDPAAEKPEESEEVETEIESGFTDLSGLHAKLFVFEEGWDARLISGSANATSSALSGVNVEFMTQLQGKKSQMGIDPILGKDVSRNSIFSLLRPYQRLETSAEEKELRQLEKTLEKARTYIIKAQVKAVVSPASEDTYTLSLTSPVPLLGEDNRLSGRCHPITLPPASEQDLSSLNQGQPIVFGPLSAVSLSSFFAFHLAIRAGEQKVAVKFVLNIPVEGMPEDRDRAIFFSLISDQSRFLRYLLFLLSAGEDRYPLAGGEEIIMNQDGHASLRDSPLGLHLLEEMIRAYSRSPEKLDRIAALVEDIKRSPQGATILPEGFDQVWAAFAEARKPLGKEATHEQ